MSDKLRELRAWVDKRRVENYATKGRCLSPSIGEFQFQGRALEDESILEFIDRLLAPEGEEAEEEKPDDEYHAQGLCQDCGFVGDWYANNFYWTDLDPPRAICGGCRK